MIKENDISGGRARFQNECPVAAELFNGGSIARIVKRIDVFSN